MFTKYVFVVIKLCHYMSRLNIYKNNGILIIFVAQWYKHVKVNSSNSDFTIFLFFKSLILSLNLLNML